MSPAPEATPGTSQPLEMWAIVEVMGHNTFAGRVTEATVAGAGFIRVDVPDVPAGVPESSYPAQAGFTKFIGPSSIYAMTPCSEAAARLAANRLRVRPISIIAVDTQTTLGLSRAQRMLGDDDYVDDDDDGPGFDTVGG